MRKKRTVHLNNRKKTVLNHVFKLTDGYSYIIPVKSFC